METIACRFIHVIGFLVHPGPDSFIILFILSKCRLWNESGNGRRMEQWADKARILWINSITLNQMVNGHNDPAVPSNAFVIK